MLSLHELQKQFSSSLKNDDGAISNYISNPSHFKIYQNSILGTLQKALKEIYPVCLKLVGDEFFLDMVTIYINENPSFSPDLNEYGATLPNFINQFKPAETLAYLSDVTKLEWAWHRAYHAKMNN